MRDLSFQNNVPDPLLSGKNADVQIRIGEIKGENSREQLWQRSNCRTTVDLEGNRERMVFDNGYFSEFGTFSITDWIGHAPKSLLAKNFGLPESTFDGLASREAYFARGAIPPEQIPENLQGPRISPPQTHKFRMLSEAPHGVFKGGREWRVDSTRFPISTTITGVILDFEPGALRELHWHPNADEWQYVIEGEISVTMFERTDGSGRNSCTRETSVTSRRVTGIQLRTSAAARAGY